MNRSETEDEKFFQSVLTRSLTSDPKERMIFFPVPKNDCEDESRYGDSPYIADTKDSSVTPLYGKKKDFDDISANLDITRFVAEKEIGVGNTFPAQKVHTESHVKLPTRFEGNRVSCKQSLGMKKSFSDGIKVFKKPILSQRQEVLREKNELILLSKPDHVPDSGSGTVPVPDPFLDPFDFKGLERGHQAHWNVSDPESGKCARMSGKEYNGKIAPVSESWACHDENKLLFLGKDRELKDDFFDDSFRAPKDTLLERFFREKKRNFSLKNFFQGALTFFCTRNFFSVERWRLALKPAHAFAGIGGIFLLGVGFVSYAVHGLSLKGSVLGVSVQGMQTVSEAIEDLKRREFVSSSEKFELAAHTFSGASKEIFSWAGILSSVNTSLPFLSKLSSGKNALEAGEHLALAGKNMAALAEIVSRSELRGSLLKMFREGLTLSEQVRSELELAQQAIVRVRVSDLPTDKQDSFLALKGALPDMLSGLGVMRSNTPAFLDVLGGNGPRKYLFLFQNNQESRATGGFIGSYGLLDIKDGEIRKFFINGIFDPDGQLKESIVPPQPIRKISAAWSLHDSNWFADFPTSAEKAIFFYEKTGGPTVDGVITMTPTVLQRILRETGPVFLTQYNVTVDADNVIPLLQYKVEKDYDKEENKPKKILSDLAPIVFDRILHAEDASTSLGVIQALHTSLREKDILLYSRNNALEGMYREMGWSGELRETQRDFVSVVNSNINGFKTDGVIEQTIRHHADIQSDGSVIDTVMVTRKHTGGDTPYEWWNAVNADYMRLYVPRGSTLLSVRGQTRETVRDPLDYNVLGFSRDALVSQSEDSMRIDPDSGTQIFEESGKTVFGNWVYVSPKESVTIEYTYRLPFSVFVDEKAETALYSLLAQKQSGSVQGKFIFDASHPKEWKTSWRSFEEKSDNESVYDGPFLTDLFFGYVFE